MSEMVERVARAIADAGFDTQMLRDDNSPTSHLTPEFHYWLKAARAAIEAMREPTEGMIAAAPRATEAPTEEVDCVLAISLPTPSFVWQAMIDEVLK